MPILACLFAMLAWPGSLRAKGIDSHFFEERIRPVLVERCSRCHGADKSESGLRVDSGQGLLEGGLSGDAVVPGDLGSSLLIDAISGGEDALFQMPPDGPLPEEVVEDFRKWVAAGAPWPKTFATPQAETVKPDPAEHWAFQPIKPVPVPQPTSGWGQTPIDAFIASRYVESAVEQGRIKPSPAANALTFLRRATYDLTGLPPTPEQVKAFARMSSLDSRAVSELIESLLASPEYGRRWGRHWLDVARYSDTAGDNSDFPIPEMALYRDYVIDAFNNDLPFDEFIREQIAGDLMSFDEQSSKAEQDHLYRRRVIATSFVANSMRYCDEKNDKHLVIGDTIDAVGQSFLGLTLACARCHDHKYDPVTTADYYGLYGYFESTRFPIPGRESRGIPRNFVSTSRDPKSQQRVEAINAQLVEAAEKKQTSPPSSYRKLLSKQRESLASLRRAELAGMPTDELRRNYQELLVREARFLSESSGNRQRSSDRRRKSSEGMNRIASLLELVEQQRTIDEVAYGVRDEEAEKVGDVKIQVRGDRHRRGEIAPRGFIKFLADGQKPQIPAGQSGRLQLANWIASPDNPLTARVAVNRIWLYHFGKGLVPDPSNFGVSAEPPTHPELLDYLAGEFIRSGWSVKAMHRLIMNSAVYQLAWQPDESAPETDSENQLYWRYDRRRLSAEEFRDTALAASGQLDLTTPGPHDFPPRSHWLTYSQHKPYEAFLDHTHRSVYLVSTRIRKQPFLTLFDGSNPLTSTGTRRTSTVPLQALYLMNGQFLKSQSKHLAKRLLTEQTDDQDRIQQLTRLCYGRPASNTEYRQFAQWLERLRLESGADSEPLADEFAWRAVAHVALMSNELMYVE